MNVRRSSWGSPRGPAGLAGPLGQAHYFARGRVPLAGFRGARGAVGATAVTPEQVSTWIETLTPAVQTATTSAVAIIDSAKGKKKAKKKRRPASAVEPTIVEAPPAPPVKPAWLLPVGVAGGALLLLLLLRARSRAS